MSCDLMESTYTELTDHLVSRLESLPNGTRYLVAISGIPGSGKTTLSAEVGTRVNACWKLKHSDTDNEPAIVVPMDGYHLTKAQLDTFEVCNYFLSWQTTKYLCIGKRGFTTFYCHGHSQVKNKEEAHHRRGAHWTFDSQGLLTLTTLLQSPITPETGTITAPSFDHAVGDPVEHDIIIHPYHKLVIMEGIYLHLSTPGSWMQIASSFDERWFVQVDLSVARERVAWRHVETGLVPTYELGLRRFDTNDAINAQFMLDHRMEATREIASMDERRL
ncbi:P-loop containing nucleoside triphosphate hydrolase protein [Endogone sp. FLAS-F59071]|nr:P-loop containing nucleoside triphosphate hydrolase protein [Endogone sp. FLAS-F59071]|eukprot:RUS17534.1 P-loop containing nucleoside triphosphate hydrolase protein [Endogone sp. FLAS-F59071]